MPPLKSTLAALTATLTLLLAACGGDGSGSSLGLTPAPPEVCTSEGQKSWVRGHLDDVYLWYREIPDVPATNDQSVEAYFYALLVPARDRFSFVANRAEVNAFQENGVENGFGAAWVNDGSAIRVSLVEPDSPADRQGIRRGDTLTAVNGLPLGVIDTAAFYAALYPDEAGTVTALTLRDGSGGERTVSLAAAAVHHDPVPTVRLLTPPDGRKVGYLLFNDHIDIATDRLAAAVRQLQAWGVSDVVLDLRYNGGGYLGVAAQLGAMLGGRATAGQVFTRMQFNDKHRDRDVNYPFNRYDNRYRPLPTLNLPRLFVLTGGQTCSASEAVINGLRPFLTVITVGDTTCGKPYGFQQADYCDNAYFAVEFQGSNSLGAAVPTTGIAPDCAVDDDLSQALGDSREARLAAALQYPAAGCPVAAGVARQRAPGPVLAPRRSPWRHNAWR